MKTTISLQPDLLDTLTRYAKLTKLDLSTIINWHIAYSLQECYFSMNEEEILECIERDCK